MTEAIEIITALVAGLALGAGAFLSFVLAPMVFRVLEPPEASRFLRALFPRYYRVLLACGVVLAGLVGFVRPGLLAPAVALAMLAGASLALVPRINAARDAGEPAAGRFRRLHGLSVVLNLAMLVASGWMVAVLAGG